MKKRKYSSYLSGGEIGGGLQKAAPGLAAIPGYGWIAGAAAYGLGSFLKMAEPKEVKYGSPGMTMATGGKINIKPSKRGAFTAAKWHEFGGPLDPIVPTTDSSTYQLTTTPDLGIVPTATPRPAPVYRSVPTGMENMQVSQYPYNPIRGVQPVNYNTLMNFKEGSSNKSKSKDRYREKSTGGIIDSVGYQTGGPIMKQDDPYNTTVTQFDYLTRGKAARNTTTPKGLEESGKSALSKGSKGEEVVQLQQFLKNKGMYSGEIDGVFGPLTEKAVKGYQKWYNDNVTEDHVGYVQDGNFKVAKKVSVDGIVGDETRSALMWRKMPKPAPKQVQAPVEAPIPTINRQFTTTDNIANAGPVVMDYLGGAALAGMAALPWAAELIPAANASGAMQNLPRVVNQTYKTFPKGTTSPGNPGPRSFAPRTPDSYGTRIGYATGGDIQLSQDAFQVKGNPQVTDGNYYPHLNAKLDHNEVVKDNFVFSDKLVNPSTGNKFSEDAKKLEKNIAKSEMKVTKFKDRIAAKTAAHQQRMSYELRETQESTATLLGHRNPDGSTKQPGQYATGGPTDPPYMVIDPQYNIFYDPYRDTVLRRDANGNYVGVGLNDSYLYKRPSQAEISRHLSNYPDPNKESGPVKTLSQFLDDKLYGQGVYASDKTVTKPLIKEQVTVPATTPSTNSSKAKSSTSSSKSSGSLSEDPKTIEAFQRWYNSLPDSGKKLNIDGKWGKETEQAYKNTSEQFLTDTGRNLVPGDMFRGQSTPISDQRYVDYTPKMSPEGKLLDATLESKYIPYTDKPLNTLPNRMLNLETRVPGAIDPLTGERQPDLLEATPGTSIANRLSPQLEALKAAKENAAPVVARPVTRAIGGTGYQTPFTVGDAMQAVDVASKFGMLIGGSEREKVYADTTPIDKASFDVRPQLYQSQRNLSNYMSSVDTSNINLRRSLFNQAYANKLNTDSQTLAQYQQMNNAATTDYQNRLSNRRRFNIGQRTYTDNINAANRGQYLNTVQNAFTSLGNFGQALNQKVVANDTMNIYSKIYPNTYSSIAEALAYEDYLKLRARKQNAKD